MIKNLIHVTSSKNRESIQRNGLIPQSILKSSFFSKKQKKILHIQYKGKKIFATIFKDNIDIYDIKNIKSFIYPVPAISMDEYEDYEHTAKTNIDFYERLKDIDKKDSKYKESLLFSLENDYNDELNNLLMKRGKYDIWLIDNTIAKVNWEDDPGGNTGNTFIGFDNANSVMTSSKINPEALELIVAGGKNLKIQEKKYPPVIVIEEYIKFLESFKNLNEMSYGANQPATHSKIINTIENHWYAAIYYNGSKEGFRLVEPYVYGKGFVSPRTGKLSHENDYYLRCYVILDTQKDPDVKKQFKREKGMRRKSVSKSGGKLGWRLMRTDMIKSWQPIRKKITAERPFYNPEDKMINNIEVSF